MRPERDSREIWPAVFGRFSRAVFSDAIAPDASMFSVLARPIYIPTSRRPPFNCLNRPDHIKWHASGRQQRSLTFAELSFRKETRECGNRDCRDGKHPDEIAVSALSRRNLERIDISAAIYTATAVCRTYAHHKCASLTITRYAKFTGNSTAKAEAVPAADKTSRIVRVHLNDARPVIR